MSNLISLEGVSAKITVFNLQELFFSQWKQTQPILLLISLIWHRISDGDGCAATGGEALPPLLQSLPSCGSIRDLFWVRTLALISSDRSCYFLWIHLIKLSLFGLNLGALFYIWTIGFGMLLIEVVGDESFNFSPL